MTLSSRNLPRPTATPRAMLTPVARMARPASSNFVPSRGLSSSTYPTAHRGTGGTGSGVSVTAPVAIPVAPMTPSVTATSAPPSMDAFMPPLSASYGPTNLPLPDRPFDPNEDFEPWRDACGRLVLPRDPNFTFYRYYMGYLPGDARDVQSEDDSLFTKIGAYHTAAIGATALTVESMGCCPYAAKIGSLLASIQGVDAYNPNTDYYWSGEGPGYTVSLRGYQAYLMLNREALEVEDPAKLNAEASRNWSFRVILTAERQRTGTGPSSTSSAPTSGSGSSFLDQAASWGKEKATNVLNNAANTAQNAAQTRVEEEANKAFDAMNDLASGSKTPTTSQTASTSKPISPTSQSARAWASRASVAPRPTATLKLPTRGSLTVAAPRPGIRSAAEEKALLDAAMKAYRLDGNGNPWEVGIAGLPRNRISR